MDTHKNASLTPKGREAMARRVIDGGLSKAAAARRFNTTPKTVAKWVVRFRAKAVVGLQDRSSRPHSSPSQTAPAVCAAVEGLRRQRHTGAQIAAEVGVSAATVSRILKRRGLNRLSALGPAEPVRRYERAARARSSTSTSKSWASSVGPAIGSPATGPARATPRGRLGTCASGDRRPFAPRLFRDPAGREARLLPAFPLQRPALLSPAWRQGRARHDRQRIKLPIPPYAKALRRLKIKHLRTKPYTPRTNGKAERFVQTSLREWAYARAYNTSEERAAELPIWLHRYKWHRPHASIGSKPPISRLSLPSDNLLRLNS
jgi:transposase InsO family protein